MTTLESPHGAEHLDHAQPPDHLGYTELGRHRHLVVSERLRGRRRELGLTQKEVVARLRRLGVDTTNKALSSLEHGAGLDVCKLPEIARALDCTLTYLVGLTSNPLRWEPDGLTWPENEPVPDAAPEAVSAPDRTTWSGDGPWILGPLGVRRTGS